jgi:DDE domain
VCGYLTCGLSLRDLEEVICEQGIRLDHSTIHRWVVHLTPMLLVAFNLRKPGVTLKSNLEEIYIKVRGEWLYLYRAIDKTGPQLSSISVRAEILQRPNALSVRPWLATDDLPRSPSMVPSLTEPRSWKAIWRPG